MAPRSSCFSRASYYRRIAFFTPAHFAFEPFAFGRCHVDTPIIFAIITRHRHYYLRLLSFHTFMPSADDAPPARQAKTYYYLFSMLMPDIFRLLITLYC